MTCDFTSVLTVIQSYQDDVWMIMKGCVQWNSIYSLEDFTSGEDRTRSVGQCLTPSATGAPAYIGFGWLVVFWGLNGPLRQYFSLYQAVFQREGERKEK